jgi:imidazolonepropionase-like amidohydrolase
MGAQLKATAISHLEEVSTRGIEDMAMAGTVAILLPTTAYIMNLRPPPVRQLIDTAVPVALGSDFNPNAHCLAMVGQDNFQDSKFQRDISYICNFRKLTSNVHLASLR